MNIKSIKNFFRKIKNNFLKFRDFFGKTNTNLLLIIFTLIILILNMPTTKENFTPKSQELPLIVNDLEKVRPMLKNWNSQSEPNFLFINEKLKEIKLSSSYGEIIFNYELEKFIYKNIKIDNLFKNSIENKFDSIICNINYCYF